MCFNNTLKFKQTFVNFFQHSSNILKNLSSISIFFVKSY